MIWYELTARKNKIACTVGLRVLFPFTNFMREDKTAQRINTNLNLYPQYIHWTWICGSQHVKYLSPCSIANRQNMARPSLHHSPLKVKVEGNNTDSTSLFPITITVPRVHHVSWTDWVHSWGNPPSETPSVFFSSLLSFRSWHGFHHVSPAISLGVEDYFPKFNITDTQGPN